MADGIAFSCGNTRKPQPSLNKIFQAVSLQTPGASLSEYHDPDLTRWANQGVLLLNSAFTCRLESPGSHYHIWHDFMAYLMEMLGTNHPDLIYVFMGSVAKEWDGFIPAAKETFYTEHPAAASYGNRPWESKDIFQLINHRLPPKEKIIWNG